MGKSPICRDAEKLRDATDVLEEGADLAVCVCVSVPACNVEVKSTPSTLCH